jgi:GT2 family glycosyltransferase
LVNTKHNLVNAWFIFFDRKALYKIKPKPVFNLFPLIDISLMVQENLLCIMDRTVPAAAAFYIDKFERKQDFETICCTLNRHNQRKKL